MRVFAFAFLFVLTLVGSIQAATTKNEIQFLPYFDSLAQHVGEPGHWFVRDAAGTTTGQHGDPTVMKGWAIYTWNSRRTNGTAGWTKICEEESMDSSLNEALVKFYVKKDEFNEAMADIQKTYTPLTSYNELKSSHEELVKTVEKIRSDIAEIKLSIQTINTSIATLNSSIEALSQSGTATQNNVVVLNGVMTNIANTAMSAQTGSTINDLYRATSNIVYSAKSIK